MLSAGSRTISRCAPVCRATTVIRRSSAPKLDAAPTTNAQASTRASTVSACQCARRTPAPDTATATASITGQCASANRATRAIQRRPAWSLVVAVTRIVRWTSRALIRDARIRARHEPLAPAMKPVKCTTIGRSALVLRATSVTASRDVICWTHSVRMTETANRRRPVSAANV